MFHDLGLRKPVAIAASALVLVMCASCASEDEAGAIDPLPVATTGATEPTPATGQPTTPSSDPPTSVRTTEDQGAGGDDAGPSDERIVWEFVETWRPLGIAPECPDPFSIEPVVDLSVVTAVLYPGQIRGGDYKPHGGFVAQDRRPEDLVVTAPFNAVLVRGSRYIEQGEQQILLDFQHPCGWMFRLDHLLTLAPEFAAAVDELPPPVADDSRTSSLRPIEVEAGMVIATAAGFEAGPTAFDLGIYDLRQTNAAAADPAWASEHQPELAYYAVCWLKLFDDPTNAAVGALPPGDEQVGAQSDYCG